MTLTNGIPDHVDELEPFFREKPQWLNLSHNDYNCGPGLRSSHLKYAVKSLAHYNAKKTEISKQTEDMRIGTLCHLAVLEGSKFTENLRIKKVVDGRTKDGKAYNADFEASLTEHSVVVTEREADMIIGMSNAILMDPIASHLLRDGVSEVSGYAVDQKTNMLMKIRPDFLRNDGAMIDYKTTRCAHPDFWIKYAKGNGYHIQAAYYRMVANIINDTPREDAFAFIAQEKEKPYNIVTYEIQPPSMECAMKLVRHTIDRIAEGYKKNEWPGYTDNIVPFTLSDWEMEQIGKLTVINEDMEESNGEVHDQVNV